MGQESAKLICEYVEKSDSCQIKLRIYRKKNETYYYTVATTPAAMGFNHITADAVEFETIEWARAAALSASRRITQRPPKGSWESIRHY